MIEYSKKLCLSILIILFAALHINADNEIKATAAVCRFEDKSSEESNLAYGIAISFYEALKSVGEHRVGNKEIKAILAKSNKEEITKKTTELEKLYEERDSLLFSYSPNQLALKIEQKDEQIEKKKSELQELNDSLSEIETNVDVDFYSIIPVELKKNEDSFIFNMNPGPVSETAEKNDLDFIVYGSIEDSGQYRLVEVRVWNNLLNEDIEVWQTAVSSDEVSSLIAPGIKAVKTAVLGRDWSELTVKAPVNSMIYIDDVFSGIGSVNALILDPGARTVTVKERNSETFEQVINLEKYELKEINVDLVKMKTRTLVIQTFPQAADIYIDSEWKGTSPLKFEVPGFPTSVMIKKDGFEQQNFFIREDSESMIDIILKPDVSEREEYVPDKRKRFYSSLGAGILSIPFTALFYSMVEQSGEAYYREYNTNGLNNTDELQRLQNANMAQYSFYLISLGLNIFLFTDTIIQAVDYVGSVEYFSE